MARHPKLLLSLLVPALALVLADLALAQAGGGSGSFGGGGGGGGGGGSFGGGSSSSGGSSTGGGGIAWLFIIGVLLLVFLGGSIAVARERRKRRLRRERVHAAAAEAAQDDDYLAADRVEREAADLWLATQTAWDQRDDARLSELVGEDLMVEWRRRLADFQSKGWHNRVEVSIRPDVQYVGLVNRDDDSQDRVTVHIAGTMRSYVQTADGQRIMREGAKSEHVSITEYWTLARRGDAWMCVSIEQATEGGHHLDAQIVATPEADTERIRGQAVTELATADAVPEGFTTADLAVFDFQGSAREEALDLSLADGRFAPDVLEVAARRAVSAWAEAVDGDDAELAAVATPDALQKLLYGADPTGKTRLVLRGPRVRRISIAGVDAKATPARMSLEVEVAATRYVEDRDTTDVVSGSKSGASTFTEHWTLALDGPPDSPWRLVATA
ncbi:MAG TPA: TIM44-like domain-containing protein [Thermoleophilaceae bacterium]|nr:TIM44-like domain-containing protein [Thermoleophilaceae bacterium]